MDLWQQRLHEDGSVDGLPDRVSHGVGMQRAALSADGTRMAYTRGGRMANVWRVPIREGRLAAWSDATQLTMDQAFVEVLGLSPDGERLFFSSDRSGNQDLWVMPAAGGEMEQLTTDPTPDWAPNISPQGDQIAFYAFRSGNRDVWVMPVNGGRARRLTTDGHDDFLPSWSPDGSQIAFISARSGKFEIWVVPAAGGEARRLTNRPDPEAYGQWSPDGQWIYFNSGDANGPRLDLWRAPTAGGTIEFVETSAKIVGWSRDGKTMYSYRLDEGTLSAVPVAGGPARPLTRGPGFLGGGKPGVLMTPSIISDGQYLYFSWREDMGDIWVMDVVGAATAGQR